MEKINKTKYIHIAIIIIGIIFILLPAFHSSLWFDESYSVALAKHNFLDIWKITGNDVHPALYYWMLHIVFLVFGNSIIAYRIFSVLAIILVGILGYTHIRKDFGEKTGIVFSFLTYFLPVMNTYAQEIRMYSWSCLIVTLMAIYGYRLYKSVKNNDDKKTKNLVLFGIFSICCCYIHYYALVTTCLENLILLIYFIKNRKQDKKALINFLILAVIQVVVYIPWLVYFMGQIKHVGGGFWITQKFLLLDTTVEVLSFQFRRQLDTDFALNTHTIIALIAALIMYIYIGIKIYKLKKEREDIKPAILGIVMYVGVILIILLISKIIMPILYSRYLLVMTGLYIFALAFIIAKEKNKIVLGIICAIILGLGIASNVENIKINYSEGNRAFVKYMQEEIKQDDIIVYSNIGNGGVVAAYFPENKQYFLNLEYWDVEEAYKSYGPGMETVTSYDFLKNYKGRIWLVDSEYLDFYERFPKDGIKVVKQAEKFEVKYHGYVYNIMLLEKE